MKYSENFEELNLPDLYQFGVELEAFNVNTGIPTKNRPSLYMSADSNRFLKEHRWKKANAIEETLKTNQKEINIYIEYSLNELIIQVKNPIVNHNIDWVSHKGGEHQGLGLTIIQEKVNLYNGIYKKQITEDTFISYIYISFHN
jgi:hypothetical protein